MNAWLYIFVTALLGVAQMSANMDCGCNAHRDAIRRTEALITRRVDLSIPVSEMPTKSGEMECVRLGFSISKYGSAEGIIVLEDSRSFDMNISAIKALKQYRFRYTKGDEHLRFTLVFRGVVGKAPPYPDT